MVAAWTACSWNTQRSCHPPRTAGRLRSDERRPAASTPGSRGCTADLADRPGVRPWAAGISTGTAVSHLGAGDGFGDRGGCSARQPGARVAPPQLERARSLEPAGAGWRISAVPEHDRPGLSRHC